MSVVTRSPFTWSPFRKLSRRAIAVVATVAALAAAFVVVPTLAAPALASSTSTASSLFGELNEHRTTPSVHEPKVRVNGYANITAHDRAVNFGKCGDPCTDIAPPADGVPTTPDAPVFDVPLYESVKTGSQESSRLFAKFLADDSGVMNFSAYNIAGVGVYTRGSRVYAVYEMLAYNAGQLPAGYLHFDTPTISGTAKVGDTLTPHWTQPTADDGTHGVYAYSFEWITGGTTMSTSELYTIPAPRAGDQMQVQITVERSGFVSRTVTSGYTKQIADGTFTFSNDKKEIGQFFGSITPYLTDTDPTATSTYVWYLGSKEILGATGYYYVPTAADVGHQVKVKETFTLENYTTVTRTYETASHFAGLLFIYTQPPTISGTAVVGDTLTSSMGSAWDPDPTFTIAWKVDGTTVQSGTGTTLLVKSAWKGKTITVEYTGTYPVYVTKSRTSASTAKVTG